MRMTSNLTTLARIRVKHVVKMAGACPDVVLACFEVQEKGIHLNDVPRGCCTISTVLSGPQESLRMKLRRGVLEVRFAVGTHGQDSGDVDV